MYKMINKISENILNNHILIMEDEPFVYNSIKEAIKSIGGNWDLLVFDPNKKEIELLSRNINKYSYILVDRDNDSGRVFHDTLLQFKFLFDKDIWKKIIGISGSQENNEYLGHQITKRCMEKHLQGMKIFDESDIKRLYNEIQIKIWTKSIVNVSELIKNSI